MRVFSDDVRRPHVRKGERAVLSLSFLPVGVLARRQGPAGQPNRFCHMKCHQDMAFGVTRMSSAKDSRTAGRSGQLAGARGKRTAATKLAAASTGPKSKRAPAQAAVPPASYRGAQMVAAFLDAKGHVSVDRVAKRFGMSKIQLAETIGLTRTTVHRAARQEAHKTQARATEMLEIVGRIADWAGGDRQAMAWYRAEPLAAFGGRTAESLVKEGRAAAVRAYLDPVATGGFA
jgi:ribosome-binding protein aMBF1 (putative translation factor)